MGIYNNLLASVAFAAFASSAAIAQVADTVAPAPEDEIVVTAQKRAQRINDVGMAITAASGDTLLRRGIDDVGGLTRLEPSLQFSKANTGTPVFTIRGVGYFDQSLAASPTVSVYQDEVPYAFSSLTKGALLDVERVEILKGPQGTLYGQNATGGAINFIAAKPTDHFAFGFDAGLARFGDKTLSGFVSGPLSSTLSARLAGSIEEGGAWQRSNTRDDKLGDKDQKSGRLLLDWRPSDGFTASLNINGWTDNSERQANQLEGFRFLGPQYVLPTPQYPGAPTNPAFYLPIQPYSQYPARIQALLANPISPQNNRAADWVAGTRPHNNQDFYQASLRLGYSISDAITITSLTNYEHYTQHDRHDDAGVNVSSTGGISNGSVKAFSQELRLNGRLLDNKLNWLVGANYDRTETQENNIFDQYFATTSYLTGGSAFSLLPSPPFQPFDNYRAASSADSKTVSAFANLEYQLTDTFSVHGGIRYTSSRQKFTGCAEIDNPGWRVFVAALQSQILGGVAVPPVVQGQCTIFLPPTFALGRVDTSLNEHNVPWRVGADWKFAPNNLLYVSVSKGFKAGASPTLGGQNAIQFVPVVQEELLSYELGVKTSFLNRMVQIEAAVFHYDYKNKQVLGRVIDPTGVFGAIQALVNIPQSEEDGAELSITLRPVGGLAFNAAATYLDSRVSRSFFNYASYSTSQADQVDFKGESFPFTPKWSLRYGVHYDWSLNGNLSAFVGADGSYQTKTTAAFGAAHAAAEGPPVDIKGYALVDVSAGVESANKRWRAELFGKNIFNKYYWTSAFYVNDTTVRVAGMPVTYGVKLRYRY